MAGRGDRACADLSVRHPTVSHMEIVYSLGGRPFKVDGDRVWDRDGRYVGRILDGMVFDPSGTYLGEFRTDRLAQPLAREQAQGKPHAPHGSHGSHGHISHGPDGPHDTFRMGRVPRLSPARTGPSRLPTVVGTTGVTPLRTPTRETVPTESASPTPPAENTPRGQYPHDEADRPDPALRRQPTGNLQG